MTSAVKKSVWVLAILFVAFYLFTRPEAAADAVRTAVEAVLNGIDQIIRFFTALVE